MLSKTINKYENPLSWIKQKEFKEKNVHKNLLLSMWQLSNCQGFNVKCHQQTRLSADFVKQYEF